MAYTPPFFLFNGHLETIFPSVFRRVNVSSYDRERIHTPDDDFLDLYRWKNSSDRVIILSHGLEGNAFRPYMLGMVQAFHSQGYDVVAWNFRGCGTELNKQLRFYHSGATEDLDAVVQHVIRFSYREIFLVGFSLGGNMTLKYLGEDRRHGEALKGAVTISVPLDLLSSCYQISLPGNRLYSHRFLRSLKNKIRKKAAVMNGLELTGIERIQTLIDFDDRYTAPLHGFESAHHYYQQCSSIRFVEQIEIPTLIINARNDPFLSPACYPEERLRNHPHVTFESSIRGGHVGFSQFSKNGLYWSEERALAFITTLSTQKIS